MPQLLYTTVVTDNEIASNRVNFFIGKKENITDEDKH